MVPQCGLTRNIHHESAVVPDMLRLSVPSRFARFSPHSPSGTHASGVTARWAVREVPTYRKYYFTRSSCEDPETHCISGTSLRSLMNASG